VTSTFLGDRGSGSPRLDAELLLGSVLDLPRVRLYISFERVLTGAELGAYRELVRRRSRHEPVAYILGVKEFYGLGFKVTRDTLIPRPETEHLVDEALAAAGGTAADPGIGPRDGPPEGRAEGRPAAARPVRVCDVGTGSGAVACAIASSLPEALVEASDVSEAALAVAKENVEALGLSHRVTLVKGDLLEAPFRAGLFDLIVANLPYVPSGDIPGLAPDVRDHEPRGALDGGPGGLDLYMSLLPQAAARLAPGGCLLCECQPDQFPALTAKALELGLAPRPPAEDLSGRERVFSAVKP
jgi:release factor glutamine methyltransferase